MRIYYELIATTVAIFGNKKNSSPLGEFFNGGPARQDFEQLETELEKAPLSSTLGCISLYQGISETFSSKWEDILTDKQKVIYKR